MTIAFRIMFLIIVSMAVVPFTVKSMNVRKLDDTGSPDDQIKCGSCPCGTTCYASPPPPSPPPPVYTAPPPPKKKPPPSSNCPPPPSGGGGGGGGYSPPGYMYITGPPGDLYPVVQNVSAGGRSFTAAMKVVVVFGLLGLLALW